MTDFTHPGRPPANIEVFGGGRLGDDGYEASYGVALYLPESLARVIGSSTDPRLASDDDDA